MRCGYCEKEFIPSNPNQIYCRITCVSHSRKKRKKLKNKFIENNISIEQKYKLINLEQNAKINQFWDRLIKHIKEGAQATIDKDLFPNITLTLE